MKKGITINGVILEEYLNIEREKEIKEEIEEIGNERFPLYRKVRTKIKTQKEENGEVKVYNQREINNSMYKDKMKEAVERGAYRDAIVIQLICGKNVYLGTRDFSERIRATGIEIKVKHLTTAVRASLVYIEASDFGEHIEKYRENSKAFWKYKLKRDIYESISLKKAFELLYGKEELGNGNGKLRSISQKMIGHPLTKDIEEKPSINGKNKDLTLTIEEEKKPLKQAENDEKIDVSIDKEEGRSALTEWLTSAFKSSEDNGGKLNFIFNGNITININKD